MEDALVQAAYNGDLARLRAALATGVDVDARDSRRGWTALHYAAYYGRTACLEILLAAGASVETPATNRVLTPLHFASVQGQAACVRALIATGANVNDATPCDFTPFTHALCCAHRRVLKILLRAGADVHTGPLASNSRNNDTNAWALVDAIQKVGGWPNYVHRRREIFASVVKKAITHDALPEAINLEIANFIEPPGGY